MESPKQISNPAHVYDTVFLQYTARSSGYAAREIASRLASTLGVSSVLDVGCATGTWLKVWQGLGLADVKGIDGSYIDQTLLEIPARSFEARDLKKPFDLKRRFDLVQCLEVAEHLPSETSSELIGTLARHAERYVLFSAAPPGQGGEFHINEQSYEFWRRHFAAVGFKPYDFVRPQIVSDRNISFWYRYNVILYVRTETASALPAQVVATAISDNDAIPDISPLMFKIRKAVVRWLPASVQTQIARTKARLIGSG